MDPVSFEQWNEAMVEKYDIEAYYSRSNYIVRLIESKRIHWILNLLCPQESEVILEVGCGAGHVLQKIPVGKLYGIDISSKMISLATRRLGERANLKKGSAERIEYPDQFFDKIICTEVLEHTLDPSVVLREIQRVVKPGGTVILSIPNEAVIDRAKQFFVKTGIFKLFLKNIPEINEWHRHDFNLQLLRTMTRGVLEEVEVVPVPSVVLPLRYVGKYKPSS